MKNAIKNAVAEAAKAYGAEGYEVKMGSSTSAAVEALKDDISSVTYDKSKSISVRCVKGGKSGYASGNIVTPEEAAELVRRACESALVVDDADEVPLFEGSPEYKEVEKKEVIIPSAEEMIKETMDMQTKIMACEKVVEGSQSFMQVSASESSFFNSAGLDLDYESGYVAKGAVAAVKDGDDAEENYEMKFADEISNDELVKLAYDGAVAKLGGKPVDSGKYNIILENGAMRSILSVFSGVFSARSAFLKTTLFAGKEGEKVAADIVTLIDDPFHEKKFGHCPFDAEGVAVYTKSVIEDGVLKTLLYNRMYAKKFDKETTGNATSAKGIGVQGLYLKPGELTEEELLEKLGDGLYITGLQGLHAGVNAVSGDFSLQASGFLVEGGKKTRAVKNITVADNYYKLLFKVTAIANNLSFGTGSSFGAPDVMFSDIAVSGN